MRNSPGRTKLLTSRRRPSLRNFQLQQLLKMPTMSVGTLLNTLNFCLSNVCESVLSDCSTCRFNFFPKCCQCSWFSTIYNFLRVRMGKSPTELDPENAVETQSDLFVLSSALEYCHQCTHLHLGGNVMVQLLIALVVLFCTHVSIAVELQQHSRFSYTTSKLLSAVETIILAPF